LIRKKQLVFDTAWMVAASPMAPPGTGFRASSTVSPGFTWKITNSPTRIFAASTPFTTNLYATAAPEKALSRITVIEAVPAAASWNSRALALEDQNTVAGMEARAKFLKVLAETPGARQPSAWESIEPNEHSYARRDFVCQLLEKAK
jgi:hypothetical protein